MKEANVEISTEEAAALLTCLEYYLLYDLQSREKYKQGLLGNYEPIPDGMLQLLNELRRKLMPIVKGS